MSTSDEHTQEKTSVKRREAGDLDKDWQMIDEGTELRQKRTEKGNSGNKVIDQIDIAAANFEGNCGSVDLCFLIDATGSMQPHINGVKAQIKKIVHNLTSQAATKQHVQRLRLALVAYRDHGDALATPNSKGTKKTFGKVFFTSKPMESDPKAMEGGQFEIFPFSTSEHEFEAFCTKVRAQGGDDQPEDVFGGLEKAVNLSWSKDSETKMIFHICDAPCHGTEFHVGQMGDNYPQGDPKGRTHTALFGRLNEMEIQYYFGKINSTTNRMVEKFAEVYDGQVYQFNVGQVNEIKESVVRAVQQATHVQRCRVATRTNQA